MLITWRYQQVEPYHRRHACHRCNSDGIVAGLDAADRLALQPGDLCDVLLSHANSLPAGSDRRTNNLYSVRCIIHYLLWYTFFTHSQFICSLKKTFKLKKAIKAPQLNKMLAVRYIGNALTLLTRLRPQRPGKRKRGYRSNKDSPKQGAIAAERQRHKEKKNEVGAEQPAGEVDIACDVLTFTSIRHQYILKAMTSGDYVPKEAPVTHRSPAFRNKSPTLFR